MAKSKLKAPAPKPALPTTENKYQEGSLVRERVHPYRKMKILKYFHRRYYCVLATEPDGKEFTLDERELMPI